MLTAGVARRLRAGARTPMPPRMAVAATAKKVKAGIVARELCHNRLAVALLYCWGFARDFHEVDKQNKLPELMALRTRTPWARALLPATRCRASGQLGALLSSPVLDVRLMTALQVLQVPRK